MADSTPLSDVRRMDHLGLVSGMARKIRLVETIDERIPPVPQRGVTVGEAVLALVLDGLGFVSRPLYLTPAFFETKPVGALIREGLTEEDLNEFVLGRALDDLYETGLSSLFLRVASRAVGLSERMKRFFPFHLDSTSFTLTGEYPFSENGEDGEEGEPEIFRITHGYSKDKRPDLKQFVLNMITLHKSRIPIWVEALDGNMADKSSFPRTIEAFLDQIGETKTPMVFVADSALYTKKTIGEMSARIGWVTRVPETVGLIKTVLPDMPLGGFHSGGDALPGIRYCELGTTFGDVPQRWVVVFSQSARDREKKTLDRAVKAEARSLEGTLKTLSQRSFSCREDAEAVWDDTFRKIKYHRLVSCHVTEETGHVTPGRPKKGATPGVVGYRIAGSFEEDTEAIDRRLSRKGFFVVATNVLDEEALPAPDLIALYKSQGTSIETGFRFFKDPLFFADAFFLKTERRIMALTMIMGLALLVYALAEEELRRTLKALKESLPNQKRKPTSRPTMRWIFQLMDGIHWIPARGDPKGTVWMKEVQKKIVSFFSPEVKAIYGEA